MARLTSCVTCGTAFKASARRLTCSRACSDKRWQKPDLPLPLGPCGDALFAVLFSVDDDWVSIDDVAARIGESSLGKLGDTLYSLRRQIKPWGFVVEHHPIRTNRLYRVRQVVAEVPRCAIVAVERPPRVKAAKRAFPIMDRSFALPVTAITPAVIRERLVALELRHADLGAILRVHPSCVGEWARGKRAVPKLRLEALARALDLTVEEPAEPPTVAVQPAPVVKHPPVAFKPRPGQPARVQVGTCLDGCCARYRCECGGFYLEGNEHRCQVAA